MRPSRGSIRTVDVLDYLSVNPGRAFSLSELASALSVNTASMSQILLALAEAGYVVRDRRRKTFELGPALVAVGHAARQQHPVVDAARPHMARLAQLGTECVGSVLLGETVMVLAVEGTPSRYGWDVRVGQRVPFLAPYGSVYAAWGDPAIARRWLARDEEPEDGSLKAALDISRERGFTLGLHGPDQRIVSDLHLRLADRPRDEQLWAALKRAIPERRDDFLLSDVDPEREYPVSDVSAPVFGRDGEVAYALLVQGIGPVTGRRALEIGEEVAAACRAVTRELGGRTPEIARSSGVSIE
jgi:DNA-binding IclR family transcriptional regulator